MKNVLINKNGQVFCSFHQSLYRPCATDYWLNDKFVCLDCPLLSIKTTIIDRWREQVRKEREANILTRIVNKIKENS